MQQKVLDAASNNKSLLVTGSAGTGKSFVLRAIIEERRAAHPDGVAVVCVAASPAVLIGGTTLHQLFGWWPNTRTLAQAKSRMKPDVLAVLKKLRVLVIDEISFVSAGLWTLVDDVLRFVLKRGGVPFGGVQVIASGDFYQLPPIPGGGVDWAWYAFQSKTFAALDVMVLQRQHRQTADSNTAVAYVSMLGRLRVGALTPEDHALLGSMSEWSPDALSTGKGVITYIRQTRKECSAINKRALAQLVKDGAETHTYKCYDSCADASRYFDSKLLPELTLAVGEMVRVTCNVDMITGLVNGVTGRVIAFETAFKYPVIQTHGVDGRKYTVRLFEATYRNPHGKVIASREQIPLMPATALTVHNCQGMSLPTLLDVKVGTTYWNEPGHAYTALSRTTNPALVKVSDGATMKVVVSDLVTKFYNPPPSFTHRGVRVVEEPIKWAKVYPLLSLLREAVDVNHTWVSPGTDVAVNRRACIDMVTAVHHYCDNRACYDAAELTLHDGVPEQLSTLLGVVGGLLAHMTHVTRQRVQATLEVLLCDGLGAAGVSISRLARPRSCRC